MTPRRDALDAPEHGSIGGRALLVAAVVLAVGATGVLVLSDDLKLMRLGIVAGLWAALVGAFIAARYRRQVAEREDEAADRQERYEFELEREVAARREHELEVEADARRLAEEESREDILALRAELQGLRQTLQTLLGGEFLVERYALRAESTRMRSLPEGHPLNEPPKGLPSAGGGNVIPMTPKEEDTDLINRVPGSSNPPPRRNDRTPEHANARFQRGNPEKSTELSDQWFLPGATEADQESDWRPSWESTPAARGAAEPKTHSSRPYAQGSGTNGTNGRGARATNGQPASNGRSSNGRTGQSGYPDPRSGAPAAASGRMPAGGRATESATRMPAAGRPTESATRMSPANPAAASSSRMSPARPDSYGAQQVGGAASRAAATPAGLPPGSANPAAASAGGVPPASRSSNPAAASSAGMPPASRSSNPAAASSAGMPPASRSSNPAAASAAGRSSSSNPAASSSGMGPASRSGYYGAASPASGMGASQSAYNSPAASAGGGPAAGRSGSSNPAAASSGMGASQSGYYGAASPAAGGAGSHGTSNPAAACVEWDGREPVRLLRRGEPGGGRCRFARQFVEPGGGVERDGCGEPVRSLWCAGRESGGGKRNGCGEPVRLLRCGEPSGIGGRVPGEPVRFIRRGEPVRSIWCADRANGEPAR